MTTTKIAEKIQARMAELDDEQRTYETCRTICIGVKEELQKLLNNIEDGEDQKAGETVVEEDETVSA